MRDAKKAFKPYINNRNGNTVWAKQMEDAFVIENESTKGNGSPGNWLVRNENGAYRICRLKVFLANYKERGQGIKLPTQRKLGYKRKG